VSTTVKSTNFDRRRRPYHNSSSHSRAIKASEKQPSRDNNSVSSSAFYRLLLEGGARRRCQKQAMTGGTNRRQVSTCTKKLKRCPSLVILRLFQCRTSIQVQLLKLPVAVSSIQFTGKSSVPRPVLTGGVNRVPRRWESRFRRPATKAVPARNNLPHLVPGFLQTAR
jgi:hypothetical protein